MVDGSIPGDPFEYLTDSNHDVVNGLVFPEPEHRPAVFGQELVEPLVPLQIPMKFGRPPFVVYLRNTPVLRTPVPETTV